MAVKFWGGQTDGGGGAYTSASGFPDEAHPVIKMGITVVSYSGTAAAPTFPVTAYARAHPRADIGVVVAGEAHLRGRPDDVEIEFDMWVANSVAGIMDPMGVEIGVAVDGIALTPVEGDAAPAIDTAMTVAGDKHTPVTVYGDAAPAIDFAGTAAGIATMDVPGAALIGSP